MQTRSNQYGWDVVYSSHDNGWYGEIWGQYTGNSVHTTEVYATQEEAERAVSAWIDNALKVRGY